MSLGIGAPPGLFALLGIPILIVLYAIQDRHKREQITTLFLIDVISEDSSSTRRIDNVRLPLSFWLQLLAIALSTALLAKLYYTQPQKFQRVLVLVDGSASMAAFSSGIPGALNQIKGKLPAANRVEWTIVTSDSPHRILYQGDQQEKARQTLTDWQPEGAGHSLDRALEVARQSAPYAEFTAVITDHKDPALNNSLVIGIGEPRSNVGFSGGNIHADGDQFRGELLIRNYSEEQQTRKLFTSVGNNTPQEDLITLAPHEIRRLSRKLVSNDGDISLRLEPDDFPFDDFLPMVIPHTRTITWQLKDGQELFSQIYRLMSRFPNLEEVTEDPALQMRAVHQSELPETAPSPLPQIQWLVPDNDKDTSNIQRTTGAVAVSHPLVKSLRFGPLLVPHTTSRVTIPENDEVLVWLNNRPVISVGGTHESPILRVLFDIRYSNAPRLPAFIVLIHRFLDAVRSRIVAHEAKNVDSSQLITIPVGQTTEKKTVKITTKTNSRTISVDSFAESTILRAPSRAGFFDITVEGRSVLHGAADFQDSREADLSMAETFVASGRQTPDSHLPTNPPATNLLQCELEGLTPVLIVLTALAIVLSWLYSAPVEKSAGISREKIQP